MKWEDTVLSREEFFLLLKAHDYETGPIFEAQAKKSFEEGHKQALRELGYKYMECKTCGGSGEIPVPLGDYPLSTRMRPCPNCSL